MPSDSQNPLHRDSQPLPADVEAIAFAFRDACERAVWGADAGLASVWDDAAIGLLEQVTIAAAQYLSDPDLSDADAVRLHRVVAALGRATHTARTGARARRQQPMRREDDPRTQAMVGSWPTVTDEAERGEGGGGKTPCNVSGPTPFLSLPPQGVGGPPSRTMTEKKWAAPAPYPLPMAQRAQDPLHPENRHIPAN